MPPILIFLSRSVRTLLRKSTWKKFIIVFRLSRSIHHDFLFKRSIATMALSRTVSDINSDFSRKVQIFDHLATSLPLHTCYHVNFDDQPHPTARGLGPSAPEFSIFWTFLHWRQLLNIFLQDKGFPIVFSNRNSFVFLLRISPVIATSIYVFLSRDVMRKRGLCCRSVSVRPSLCLVWSCIVSRRLKISFNFCHGP